MSGIGPRQIGEQLGPGGAGAKQVGRAGELPVTRDRSPERRRVAEREAGDPLLEARVHPPRSGVVLCAAQRHTASLEPFVQRVAPFVPEPESRPDVRPGVPRDRRNGGQELAGAWRDPASYSARLSVTPLR